MLLKSPLNACARNENGYFCQSATSRFREEQSEDSALACSPAINGLDSCPSPCRSFLESARSILGCCINTYINTTGSSLLYNYHVTIIACGTCATYPYQLQIVETDCQSTLRKMRRTVHLKSLLIELLTTHVHPTWVSRLLTLCYRTVNAAVLPEWLWTFAVSMLTTNIVL